MKRKTKKSLPKVLKLYTLGDHAIENHQYHTPALFDLLAALDISIDIVAWNGAPEMLPIDERVLVEVSRLMDIKIVARRCNELGHLCYLMGETVCADGSWDEEHSLVAEALYFLINNKFIAHKKYCSLYDRTIKKHIFKPTHRAQ